MKYFLFIFLFIFSVIGFSQIPPGYYDSTIGKTGYALKTELSRIITAGHIDRGYSALYTGYLTSDSDWFYENDSTVLDMYSENPSGADSYFYNHGSRRCGSYSAENNCHNREHLFPQSGFGRGYPMRTDIHHVVPSDGYVNGQRGSLPFGEVTSTTWTSQNGSKKGPCTFPGYANLVFEPIDEFKGDIARCMLYFATRYESQISSWTWGPLNGTSTQVYDQWFVNLLVKWHLQDTVSQREIVRNNAAYTFQGNRNPFIDSPQWVTQIWTSTLSTSVEENTLVNVSIFPNPTTSNSVTIENEYAIESVEVYSMLGAKVISHSATNFGNKQVLLTNLPKGVLLVKIKSGESFVVKKLVVN